MTGQTPSNLDNMRAGKLYWMPDPEILAIQARATAQCAEFNAAQFPDAAARVAFLRRAFTRYEPGFMSQPQRWWFGQLQIGPGCFFNVDCQLLDNAPVTFGAHVLVGPRAQFITATHPLEPEARALYDAGGKRIPGGNGMTRPVVIGDNVWIGASAIILPGVTAGAGSTIGAGSMVTRNIPPGVLAAGNPCRVIRKI